MAIDFVLVPTVDARSPEVAVSSYFYFDPSSARRQLAAAAAGGFGAVVVDDAAGPLANLDIVANIAQWNASLDIAVTHWAGVLSPAVAAADIAALDRLAGGRLALRLIVEGKAESAEARGHLAAWQRTDEYLTLLKRLWSNARPIDHEGPFYRLRGALVADKGPRGLALPIRMSGRSGTAVEVSARHATVFELPLGSFSETLALMDRVRAAAARWGRSGRIRFAAPVHADDEWFARGGAVLPRYVAAGVSEFMVFGLSHPAALRRFEAEIIRPLAGSQPRQPAMFPRSPLQRPARF